MGKNTSIENSAKHLKNPTRKTSRKKSCITILIVIVAIMIALVAVVYLVYSHYYKQLDYKQLNSDYSIAESISPETENSSNESNSPDDKIENINSYLEKNIRENQKELNFDNENVYNILLIGTDNRSKDETGRSDSMIIVSINRETKQITLASILRDTYVSIPKVGNNRINAAYAYGGVELLLETIQTNFKIKIDQYAMVNFYGFMNVIDQLGGISMDVSADEIEVMQNYIKELNRLEGADENLDMLSISDAGNLHLNGKQALAYSRVRYVGNGDFGRTDRQRQVLTQVMEKIKQSNLVQLNDLANVLLPQITTNLTQGEIFSLMLHAGDYMGYSTSSFYMPIDGSFEYLRIDGMSVLGIDFDENLDYWYTQVYKVGK